MIYRDLYCENCNYEIKDVIFNSINDPCNITCPNCNALLKNKCVCGSFELKYNNKTDCCGWSDSGYSSSRYYEEIKAQKK